MSFLDIEWLMHFSTILKSAIFGPSSWITEFEDQVRIQ